MATTEVERLVVSLEASITKYERTMQKALGVTNNTMRNIERRQATMVQKLNAGWTGMQRGIAGAFAGAAALRGAQELIDASTRIENSLKVVGLEGQRLEKVYDSLFASAQRNMAPLETLTTLYSRLGLAQKELGVTNDELLNFTDKVALALRVQGTTAQEARGALIQLSQAMGSGIVRAEEFNSIVEGAPTILRATAAGLKEAGGSVAALRKLVIDGKVSSEAFFRAFEAGSVILESQVANAEVTISQQFVRLQNVLIDVAGKFNDTTDASNRIGGSLGQLALFIERVGGAVDANKESIGWFIDKIGEGVSNLPGFAAFMQSLENVSLSLDVDLQTARAEQEAKRFTDEARASLEHAIKIEEGWVNEWRARWSEMLPPELFTSIDTLINKVMEGGEEATTAQLALQGLGAVDTPFSAAIGQLNNLVAELQRVRGEANATAVAVAQAASGGLAMPSSDIRTEQAMLRDRKPPATVKQVSLDDYGIPAAPGKGGSKQSPAEKYADSLADYQRRIDMMNQETALLSQLSPLVNDYGFAVEKLRAAQELENAAKKAGIELGPAQREQIEQLSTAYAQATADAARLAEAQGLMKQSFDDLQSAARSALDSIIDGFLEGRDAGEIFNSVLKDLAKNLLSMGLNLIGGGMKMGGFNPLGFLGGMFGFASGTANTGGRRGEPRGVVHGQEAVIPLPNGGRVPVDIRMPAIPQMSAAQPMALTVHVVSDDEKFSAYVTDRAGSVVAQAAPAIVAGSVQQANKSAPSALARYQSQRVGSDYRT